MASTTRRWNRVGLDLATALLGVCLGGCDASVSPTESPAALGLKALDGSIHHPIPKLTDRTTVLLFTASDCPVANGYVPEIRRVCAKYGDRGVRFYVVNVETNTSVEALAGHAAEYGLPHPILMDRQHRLADHVGAKITPEAVVLLPGGHIAYRGRIDDQHRELGARRPAATQRELRDALDAVLAGHAVAVPRAAAVGCFIEDWAQ